MTEQSVHNYDDEISLLDILVTLAESWKLLVFGPLIAGLLAVALSFLWPKTFESVAIVRLTEAELALLNSAPVLDPVVEKFGLLTEFDGIQEDARQYLGKSVVGKFDKKTNLATITAVANTPERAQELSKQIVDSLLIELLPKGKNKDQIEQKINSNEGVISSHKDALEQLRKQMGKFAGGDAALEVMMKYYALLTADVASKEMENIELRKSLLVKGEEIFVQRAILPHRKVSPKRSAVALVAVLLSGFALLMFVFIRKVWASASQEKHAVQKIASIKKHLNLNQEKALKPDGG